MLKMATVRYKPGEALRWLEGGADRIRESSWRKATSVFRREGARSVGRDVRDVAGALWDVGAATVAEFARKQAEAAEYVLDDEAFTVVSLAGQKRAPYSTIKRMVMQGDRCLVVLERGSITIRPFAHLSAGRVRVPIGWSRNGVEVPFELLIEEISARADVEVEIE